MLCLPYSFNHIPFCILALFLFIFYCTLQISILLPDSLFSQYPLWILFLQDSKNHYIWLTFQKLILLQEKTQFYIYFFIDSATLNSIPAHLISHYARKSMNIRITENHWEQIKHFSNSAATFQTYATIHIRETPPTITLLSIIKPEVQIWSTFYSCFIFSVRTGWL